MDEKLGEDFWAESGWGSIGPRVVAGVQLRRHQKAFLPKPPSKIGSLRRSPNLLFALQNLKFYSARTNLYFHSSLSPLL
jgi:hypothetical protein